MATTTISRESLKNAIRAQYVEALKTGRHWHYVRVWVDGGVTRGAEPSRCVPESEYYRRGDPHPVTAWELTANGRACFSDGVFEVELCAPAEAECWATEDGTEARDERDARHPVPVRLTDVLVEDLDWDAVMPGVEERLSEAGYELED